MRFGLTAGLPRTGEQIRTFARTVESSGFDELPGRPSAMPDIAQVIKLLR